MPQSNVLIIFDEISDSAFCMSLANSGAELEGGGGTRPQQGVEIQEPHYGGARIKFGTICCV